MSVSFSGLDSTRPHPKFEGTWTAVRLSDNDDDFEEPNFSNTNARAVLDLLGLPFEDGTGAAAISDVRRAIMRARATFEKRAPALVREDEVQYGRPVDRGGVVELRPLRMLSFGLDAEGLRSRLELVAAYVERVAARGATHLSWG